MKWRNGIWTVLVLFSILVTGCADAIVEPPISPPAAVVSEVGEEGDDTASPDATGLEAAQANGGEKEQPAAPQTEVTLTAFAAADFQKEIDKHNGKVVLVDFWGTWCLPCRKGFPHTVELAGKYAKDGLAVISVGLEFDVESGQPRALAFLKEQKATFTNLICNAEFDEELAEVFDIPEGALPHYKIYDRKGQLLKKIEIDPEKGVDHEKIESAVREALGL